MNYSSSNLSRPLCKTHHFFLFFICLQVISYKVRVPIIKLKDREKSYETDISVENWCSVRNAFLLRCYSECDPRVKPLVMVIKLWAQNAGITDAKLKRLAGSDCYEPRSMSSFSSVIIRVSVVPKRTVASDLCGD